MNAIAMLWVSLSVLGADPVPAGDDALEALLDETVITGASKSAQVTSAAPATVTVITAEAMRQYGIHSLDEALNYLSLGMVTQNPLHSVDVGARGVLLTADFGNHVLLLLDGQTLNEQWDGTAYFERGAAIPWELIDHIEVIVGPGSVLYGSNAMFGVINVVTRRARDYGKLLATIDTSGSAPVDANDQVSLRHPANGGGSIRVAGGGGATFTLFGHEAELVGQAEYYRAKGPSFTFAPEAYGNDAVTGQPKNFGPNTAPGMWGGLASRSYVTEVPTGLVRFTLGELTAQVRAATYWRSTPYVNEFNVTQGDFDDPNAGERDRFFNADVRWQHRATSWLETNARLYLGLYDYQQSFHSSAAEDCADGQSACRRIANGNSRWVGLELQGHADWASDGRWLTLLGVDGRLREVGGSYDVNADDGSSHARVGAYSRNEAMLGFYLQQEARPLSWLSLNAGARLDVDNRFGARLSPRAAVAATAPWGGTLKLIYSEAFRAPTAYELYYTDGHTQIPGTGLKPESVRSGELSYEQRFGLQRVRVGGFLAQWDNMVSLTDASDAQRQAAIAQGLLPDGTTDAVVYRNVSKISNFGGDLAVEGSALSARLHYGLNFTLAHSARLNADGSSTPLTVAPQAFGNARASWDFGTGRPTFGLIAFFAAPRPIDRAYDSGWATTPMAPAEFDLKATLGGPLWFADWLSYRVSATYGFGARSPYAAGPVQDASSGALTAPQLAPVDRLQLGLQLTAHWP